MYISLNKFKTTSTRYNIISICCLDGRTESSTCIIFVKRYSLRARSSYIRNKDFEHFKTSVDLIVFEGGLHFVLNNSDIHIPLLTET